MNSRARLAAARAALYFYTASATSTVRRIPSAGNRHVLALTNWNHQHRLSLTLVFSCQKIHDLSLEVSLSLCLEERIHYSQAVTGLSTAPLIFISDWKYF